ncbi:MAG: 2-oxoglutarate oxidoreductase [Deltaproteobacteria bacterium]|nr:2-oxoglutarate oxidoreductase [Deltaproteobacteria bacterium]
MSDYRDIPAEKVSPASEAYNAAMPVTFCAGCGHGTVNVLLSEVIEELGIQERAVMIAGVGCGTASLFVQNIKRMAVPHGRASDVATGVSRVLPDRVVVQYSGDGDACAIGLAGLLHACARRENFIVLIYNNNAYGMTGGQLGPTTSEVVPTTTFIQGRDKEIMGYPLDIVELAKALPGCVFAARERITTGKNVFRAKKTLKKAFEYHVDGVKGIKLIDFLGNCNVNWKGAQTFTPVTANQLIEDEVSKYFVQGTVKEPK